MLDHSLKGDVQVVQTDNQVFGDTSLLPHFHPFARFAGILINPRTVRADHCFCVTFPESKISLFFDAQLL